MKRGFDGFLARATVAALMASTAPALAEPAPTSRYTKLDLKPPACRADAGPAEGFTCTGLGGWRALIGFPAVGASITLVRADREDRPELEPTDGRSLTVGDVGGSKSQIEWRGGPRGGGFEPRAAILRVVILDPAQRQETIEAGRAPNKPKTGQVLIVYRLAPKGACRIAYVDAGANPNANDLARAAADTPGDCPVEHVTIQGKASPILDGNLR